MAERVLVGHHPVSGGVGAQLGGKSLTCLQAGVECTRAGEFHQRWGKVPAALLVLGWEGEGYNMYPGFS